MSDKVLYRQDGPIVTITLNDPAMRNPISERETVDALVAAIERLNQDNSARVAILTGAGTAFSSGGDLRAMQKAFEARSEQPALTPHYYKFGIQRIPLAFEKLDVPIIAAVNGPAIGAGLDLACMCDMRIAGGKCQVCREFRQGRDRSGRWRGVAAASGRRLLESLRDGVHRRHAERGGGVNLRTGLTRGAGRGVAGCGEGAGRTRRGQSAVCRTDGETAADRGAASRLDTLLELSASLQALAHATGDHREAVNAFLEKRKPEFKGD